MDCLQRAPEPNKEGLYSNSISLMSEMGVAKELNLNELIKCQGVT